MQVGSERDDSGPTLSAGPGREFEREREAGGGAGSPARAHLVRFVPSERRFAVIEGGSLLRAALRAKLPLASSCRGTGVCLACRVRVIEGAENLSPPSVRELAAGVKGEHRLACLARVYGPVTLTTPYW